MKISKNLTTVTPLSKALALALYFVLMGLGFLLGVQYQKGKTAALTINSFDECVAAGNRVAESYPPICFTNDGRSFSEPLNTQLRTKPEESN